VLRKKLRVVSLDEVKITRRGDSAEFVYADDAMGSMLLKVGSDVGRMSDEVLLEKHNETVRAMEAMAADHEHVAVEVPVGRPQLRYSEASDQWVPRGAVVRCRVHDGGPDAEATVEIDDRELSLREFGRLLTTYAGWGMRIVFVPDDEIHLDPAIEVREPDDDGAERPAPAAVKPAPRPAKPRSPAPGAWTWSDRERVLLRMPIYQLRITLGGTEPPGWRCVPPSGNLSLKKLHQIIQAAMGWTDSHLHEFASADGKVVASDPRFGLDHAPRDEAKVKLRSFAPEVGSRFRYDYDLGDSWRHDILVEEIRSPEDAGRTPRCLGGARACPPEDCGGVPGYFELVSAMRDRGHPQRKHYLDWLGQPFAPEAFDLDEANERLRRLK